MQNDDVTNDVGLGFGAGLTTANGLVLQHAATGVAQSRTVIIPPGGKLFAIAQAGSPVVSWSFTPNGSL